MTIILILYDILILDINTRYGMKTIVEWRINLTINIIAILWYESSAHKRTIYYSDYITTRVSINTNTNNRRDEGIRKKILFLNLNQGAKLLSKRDNKSYSAVILSFWRVGFRFRARWLFFFNILSLGIGRRRLEIWPENTVPIVHRFLFFFILAQFFLTGQWREFYYITFSWASEYMSCMCTKQYQRLAISRGVLGEVK